MKLSTGEKTVRIGNEFIEAVIGVTETPGLREIVNKRTGTVLELSDSRECTLRVGSSRLRIDIAEWRFHVGSGDAVPPEEDSGYLKGFFRESVDEGNWAFAQQLNVIPVGLPGHSVVTYPGYGWYRSSFDLPRQAEGEPIEFGMGGSDDQDWLEYWLYVGGVRIGHRRTEGWWHEAPRFTVEPGTTGYEALRFGGRNSLAVQVRGLDRRHPRMSLPDAERFSAGLSPLVDQYISVGPAYRDIEDFQLTDYRKAASDQKDAIELDFINTDEGLELKVRYWISESEPVLYKQISATNRSEKGQTLLEIEAHRFEAGLDVSPGGHGAISTIGDEFWCGVRHPAGVCKGEGRSIVLRLLPGKRIGPGETYQSKVAVWGVGEKGHGARGFIEYLESYCPRKKEFLSFFHNYGMFDVASALHPTHVTEELALRYLDLLEGLIKRGVHFDYYFMDAGWCNPTTRLRDFHKAHFPDGPRRFIDRVKSLGLKLGLWFSTVHGPATFFPGKSVLALAECGTLPHREEDDKSVTRGALCMASEPCRRMFVEDFSFHVHENGVSGFKLDGIAWFCTNPSHGHLPGKYSTEPIIDSMIEVIEKTRRECPEAFFMLYWNFRSPWWLLYGNTLYERGILMEGATPSDFPARHARQSISVSFDQTTHLAWDLLPIRSGDSLGVWLSPDTRWGSWIGLEGWRDAWVMEIARGSMMAQLWGEIDLLNDEDIEFLATMSKWVGKSKEMLKEPRRILGDPWKAEPYGYAYGDGKRGIVFLYNPRFEGDAVKIGLGDEIGIVSIPTNRMLAVKQFYPFGKDALSPVDGCYHVGESLMIDLVPFEVKVLEISEMSGEPPMRQPAGHQRRHGSRKIDCHFQEISRKQVKEDDAEEGWFVHRAVAGRALYVDTDDAARTMYARTDERDRRITKRVISGKVDLPPLDEKRALLVIARLSRGGVFWHHHAIFDIVRLTVGSGYEHLPFRATPDRWHEQAGGWSWILFEVPLHKSSKGRQLSLDFQAYLPESVDVEFQVWLYQD